MRHSDDVCLVCVFVCRLVFECARVSESAGELVTGCRQSDLSWGRRGGKVSHGSHSSLSSESTWASCVSFKVMSLLV